MVCWRALCLLEDTRDQGKSFKGLNDDGVMFTRRSLQWLAQMLEEMFFSLEARLGFLWLKRHFPTVPFVRAGYWVARHYRIMMDWMRRPIASPQLSLTKTSTLESSLENGNGSGSVMQLTEDRIFNTSPEPIFPQIRSISASTIRSPVTTPATSELNAFQQRSMDSVTSSARWRSGTDPALPQKPPLAHSNTYPVNIRPDSPESQDVVSSAKKNFRAIAKKVIVQNRTTQAMAASVVGGRKDSLTSMPPGVARARTQSNNHPLHPFSIPRRGSASEGVTVQPRKTPRLAHIVPSLRALQTRETLNEHTALVRHLQFSPDGEFCESTFNGMVAVGFVKPMFSQLQPALGIKLLLYGKLVNSSRCTENSRTPKAS